MRQFSLLCAALVALVAPRAGADLLITEFMASNEATLFDGLGEPSDWIEIHNPTAAAVNLAGWQLRDSTTSWPFPSQILPAGGYLLVFASGKTTTDYVDPRGSFHTNFKLDPDGEPLALLRPDGSVSWAYAAPVPVQKKDVSYGLTTDSTPLNSFDSNARLLVPSSAVNEAWRGNAAFDDGAWLVGKAAAGFNVDGGTVVIGGQGTVAYRVFAGTPGNQAHGGSLGHDFVVNEPVHITELGVFDDNSDGLQSTIVAQLWRRDERGTPGVYTDDVGSAILVSMTFTPASSGALLEGSRFKQLAAPLLLQPGSYTMVAYGYSAAERNGNAGLPTPPDIWETNSGGGRLTFVGGGRYGGAGAFPATVDAGPPNRYAAGTFKFGGSSDPTIRTDLRAQMHDVNATALMRVPFNVADPAAFDSLQVRSGYDDGFVAWINGVEIARRNAPEALAFDARATGAGNAAEMIPAGVPAGMLVAGQNVLAIQGLNVAPADRDFFFGAELTGFRVNTGTARYFARPTPGGPNGATGALGYVADTQFSIDRGFFVDPISVAITTTTADAVIRYTTDGSEPTETNGATYSAPLAISATTCLRARAFKAGFEPTNIDTHTYLFLADVATRGGAPPPGYPSAWGPSGGQVAADYGFTTAMPAYAQSAGSSTYTFTEARDAHVQSLRALPTLSIVTDKANLFDPATGIYMNPQGRGEAWERPVSAELMFPDGTEGFQVNGGLQVMGNSSRDLSYSPKLNLRIVFKDAFGPNWLRYSFFGPDGPTRFKSIGLRANKHDSWLNEQYGSATYIGDQWTKEAHLASGQPATLGRFVHLYINGFYWGLYNPTERPNEFWAETALGGENEDYDSVNFCCGPRLDAGDFTEWNALLAKSQAGLASAAAYQEIQGNNADGTRNPALKKLIDLDNFIDFVINGQYAAAIDWPGNYFAAYDNVQTRSEGYKFITWDNDVAFRDLSPPGLNVNSNKVTPPEGFSHAWWQNSPGVIDAGIRQNAEYRVRFADRVFQHYFHGGIYTVQANIDRWNRLRAIVKPALYAESGRWGDYKGALRTVQDHWEPRVQSAVTNYFPTRGNVVLSQLRAAGLYPNVNPPEFNQHGGTVPSGFELRFTAAAPIYYTINGPDPRLPGGAIDPAALPATSGQTVVVLNQSCVVRARALSGTTWSALNEVTFVVGNAAGPGELLLTELNYHPAEPSAGEAAAGFTGASFFEFIELTNITGETLDLTGVHFSAGIQFHFTGSAVTLLAPGTCVLVVANRDAFLARYGSVFAGQIAGVFEKETNLSDSGEQLALLDIAGQTIAGFTYSDDAPWPTGADGTGASLILQGTNPADPTHWRASFGPPTPGERVTLHGEWLRRYFTPGEQGNAAISGDLVDIDFDGLPNLIEFTTGNDPRRADFSQPPVSVRIEPIEVGGGTSEYLVITFRRTREPGFTQTLETSGNFAAWMDATPQLILLATESPGGGWETVRYRSAQPFSAGAGAGTFWRLRVSRP